MSETITCTVDATGIHAPEFPAVQAYLEAQFRAIYGADVYLGNDSQDGQLLGIFAKAIDDANSMAVAVYNAFSPQTAQGVGLSSNVKINGIARLVPSRSLVDLMIVGQAGTVITNGYALDSNQNRWNLPAAVIVPFSGQINVTASAHLVGAITALAGTITTVGSPTFGWQTVNNPTNANPGAPTEDDATLRVRQSFSTALPSLSVFDGTIGAVASVPGVTRYRAYENDTAEVDANGLPSHSIALVVDGGNALAIATAIANKKTPGTITYGTTIETVTDAYGIPRNIRFYRPTEVAIVVQIDIDNLPGYTSIIGGRVKQAVVDYINGMAIGVRVYRTRLFVPANLNNDAEGGTFELLDIRISALGNPPPIGDDVPILFNQAAVCSLADVTLTVL